MWNNRSKYQTGSWLETHCHESWSKNDQNDRITCVRVCVCVCVCVCVWCVRLKNREPQMGAGWRKWDSPVDDSDDDSNNNNNNKTTNSNNKDIRDRWASCNSGIGSLSQSRSHNGSHRQVESEPTKTNSAKVQNKWSMRMLTRARSLVDVVSIDGMFQWHQNNNHTTTTTTTQLQVQQQLEPTYILCLVKHWFLSVLIDENISTVVDVCRRCLNGWFVPRALHTWWWHACKVKLAADLITKWQREQQ